ncbi:DUF2141 domain-containing protein [Maribacter ulvicola]|uniref:Uncharacterized protein n=1 Tax=Maribacter ulvicola TaxID=228959 RepID=A0A1N6ZCG3_9FLAO|nr:DUF2141 domain-containing protein [Maribacter ulvicola]SIR24602.1 hypothetical protein SAMN05421797_108133 [Maribacter ulvicola]
MINDNQRMDFEINGMSKEDYVMSGKSMPIDAPTFKDVKYSI